MAAEAQQPVVRCPQCNADSSIAKNYCADCGAPLEAGGYRQLIRAEVATVLADRLKDKQVVEVELFDSVVERLLKYLKWFSAALALPLAVTGIGLTFFGFQKVHDVNSLAEKVDREVKPKAESALHDADEASNAASQAKHSAEEVTIQVNKELASARNITAKVEDLSSKVGRLESQTAVNVNSATKRIEGQLKDVDQRVSDAQSQINEQQRKLTDTGELVKSLFTNSRIEQFFEGTQGRYVVREGNNLRVVYMMLHEVPIPQSVQIQFHVYTQPRDSYIVTRNVVIFFWGDAAVTLKQHPLLVSYVADPHAQDKPFQTLSTKNELVFADSFQLPDAK